MPNNCHTCGAQLSGSAKRNGRILCPECLSYHQYKEDADEAQQNRKEEKDEVPNAELTGDEAGRPKASG